MKRCSRVSSFIQNDNVLKTELGLITFMLALIALRPFSLPEVSHAQSSPNSGQLYIEPGVTMLRSPGGNRQVLGKVLIDLSTGKVWGLPTTTDQPYPVDFTKQGPPTSKPFLLGKFDLSVLSQQ